MRLTIFAATGGIGRHALDLALAAGHEVTAVVRDPKKLPPSVRGIAADLSAPDPAILRSAVAGADAVLSGLGPRTLSDAGITEPGTRAIVDAMRAAKVRRLVVVSAAPVSTVPSPLRPDPPAHDPGDGFFTRWILAPFIKMILRKHYADLARMEDVLRESGLEWTSLRPPRLTNKPMTAAYRTAVEQSPRGGLTVSRADVAHFMLRVLLQPDTVGKAIGIAN
jgi:uncharacterized protein YbjT (DUF2867 family)